MPEQLSDGEIRTALELTPAEQEEADERVANVRRRVHNTLEDRKLVDDLTAHADQLDEQNKRKEGENND